MTWIELSIPILMVTWSSITCIVMVSSLWAHAVCVLRFYCEECEKQLRLIMISRNIKPLFIRVSAILCVHFLMEGVLNAV